VRGGPADLARMVAVVQADAHHFADAGQRTAEPRPATHERQPLELQPAQPLEAGWREHIRRDVLHHAREISHTAGRVDHTRFLRARAPVPDELHAATGGRRRPKPVACSNAWASWSTPQSS